MSEQNQNHTTENAIQANSNDETAALAKANESQGKNSPDKKKKKKRKLILISAAALLVIGIVAVKLLTGSDSSVYLSTHTLAQETIEQKISATGTVTGSDSAEIGSSLNYEVIRINVKEGDIVKKGDILGVLDSKVLQSDYDMAVKELEVSRLQLQEQRASAELAVQERQIDYNEAKRQNEIMKQLYQEGGASNDELVQSNIALEKAAFALSAAQDQLARASASGSASLGIDIKQEIVETKKDNLDKANITSPIDGTVTRVNAKIGRIPTAQDQVRAMFIVENLQDLIIKVSISEYDISNVKVGQKVIITSDVLRGGSAEGEVARIAPTGESVQGTSTKEMRIPVEIKITSKGDLIAGVNARAEILIEKRENVLVAPLEAILDVDGEKYVLLGNDGTIKRVKVTTGVEGLTNVEISSSELKAGDIIITNPSLDYADGMSYKAQG